MNIDKTTGLPEVPEGYFWEVVDSEGIASGSSLYLWVKEPGYYLQLKSGEKVTTIVNKNHRRVRNPEYTFMGKHAKYLDVWDEVEEVSSEETVHYDVPISSFDQEGYEGAMLLWEQQYKDWEEVWGAKHRLWRQRVEEVRLRNQRRSWRTSYSYYEAMESEPEWRGDEAPRKPKRENYTNHELTEKAILETAKGIIAHRDETLRQKSLVGKYPPNKLSIETE